MKVFFLNAEFMSVFSFLAVLGLVKYKVQVQGASSATLKVTLIDRHHRSVASSSEPSGVLKVVDAKLWWPYLMHEDPGYLYSLEVRRHPVVSRLLIQEAQTGVAECRWVARQNMWLHLYLSKVSSYCELFYCGVFILQEFHIGTTWVRSCCNNNKREQLKI